SEERLGERRLHIDEAALGVRLGRAHEGVAELASLLVLDRDAGAEGDRVGMLAVLVRIDDDGRRPAPLQDAHLAHRARERELVLGRACVPQARDLRMGLLELRLEPIEAGGGQQHGALDRREVELLVGQLLLVVFFNEGAAHDRPPLSSPASAVPGAADPRLRRGPIWRGHAIAYSAAFAGPRFAEDKSRAGESRYRGARPRSSFHPRRWWRQRASNTP